MPCSAVEQGLQPSSSLGLFKRGRRGVVLWRATAFAPLDDQFSPSWARMRLTNQ